MEYSKPHLPYDKQLAVLVARGMLHMREEWLRKQTVALLLPLLIDSLTDFGIFGFMNPAVTLYQVLILSMTLRKVSVRGTELQPVQTS